MADAFTIYKLTVLDMLDRVDFPLTNAQIANFFLEQDYTGYFSVQQAISDLSNAGLIRPESTHGNTRYHITDTGRETLRALQDKLNDDIDKDIISYFNKNGLALRAVNSIVASYDRTQHRNYAVHCQFQERGTTLVDITLTVKTREQAEAVCENWKARSGDVYACLMDALMK